MRTTALALCLTLAAGGIATAAAAQQGAPPPGPAMPMRGGMGRMGGGMGALMRADGNGDGIITREEAVAAADARFDALDTNHDGVVSPDEMRAGMPPMPPMPQGAGASPPPPAMPPLTRQQFHDRALRPFDRIDANHDGKIDQAEIAAYRAAMQQRRMERQDGGAPAPAGQPR